uniref:Uncharacterized protein n=1 Tax=Amphora coffeiformis TaxID=265554 RepID=A0A7S3KVM4_9STRA|mmetsp:Transcript_4958/g.9867  ORF Transcript_4958/g.9867 Transcript_4958/m.9867 type:complete len:317 (-) Transcript_4958:77-1027(-)|eukprot:scaffold2655_cov179-Amphora_coffeaeformis.AAC.28
MRVSTKGNQRPALGERTNSGLPTPFQVQSTADKHVEFSTDPIDMENITAKEPKKLVPKRSLQSALRPTGRYGKGVIDMNPHHVMTRSLSQRLAVEREEEFEPDASMLRQCISLLQSKLSEAQDAHEETLIQIEEQKKRDMAKIYRECVAKHEKKVQKEEETSSHDTDVIRETIDTLRDYNSILRKENRELLDDIDEIKSESDQLMEHTANYQKAIDKVKKEITEQQLRNDELQSTVDFLKMRKREYEDAKFAADLDIEAEREEAIVLRKKLEIVVAEIDRRASQRAFADAVRVAVGKDFERVESSCSTVLSRSIVA